MCQNNLRERTTANNRHLSQTHTQLSLPAKCQRIDNVDSKWCSFLGAKHLSFPIDRTCGVLCQERLPRHLDGWIQTLVRLGSVILTLTMLIHRKIESMGAECLETRSLAIVAWCNKLRCIHRILLWYQNLNRYVHTSWWINILWEKIPWCP